MSIVWDFFEVCPNDYTKVSCILCNTTLSRGGKNHSRFNTSNMLKHIHRIHSNKLKSVKKRRNDDDTENSSPRTSFDASRTTFKKKPINTQKTKIVLSSEPQGVDVKKLIAEMIIIDMQPFGIVEGKGFKQLFINICPEYDIPNKDAIMKMINFEIYESIMENITLQLNELKFLSLEINACNTKENDLVFLSITAHGLNSSFTKFSFGLGAYLRPVNCLGSSLNDLLLDCLGKFSIPQSQVHMIVCSNEVMLNGMSRTLFNSSLSFHHSLQSIAYDNIFRKDFVKQLISKVHQYVLISNQPTNNELDVEKEFYGLAPLSVIQEVYYLLEQLKKFTVKNNSYLDFLYLSQEELKLSNQLNELLKPFEQAIRESSTNLTGISSISPCVKSLQLFLEKVISSKSTAYLTLLNPIALDIKNALLLQYGQINQNKHLSLATYLDPRFKKSGCMNSTITDFKSLILDEFNNSKTDLEFINLSSIKNGIYENIEVKDEICQQSFPAFNHYLDLVLLGTEFESTSRNNFANTNNIKSDFYEPLNNDVLEKEIEDYETHCLVSTFHDPLKWWQSNNKRFPNLSKLALKLLCPTHSCKTMYEVSEDALLRLSKNKDVSMDVEKMLFIRQNLMLNKLT